MPNENPADVHLVGEAQTPVQFSDLSERRAVKLAAMTRYVSKSHFVTWEQLRRMPDFETLEGIFTPLVLMEIEATDEPVTPNETITARGESTFGKVLDADGNVRNITRDGLHRAYSESGACIGSVRFVNVFTRYDKDPAKRKITEIPPELGVGSVPSRVTSLPDLDELLQRDREPDFAEAEPNAWYYTQTDPNRHVNSLAYLDVVQQHVATRLHRAGHPMDLLWACRARIRFRKPCFRGEEYRRLAWKTSDAPMRIGTAIVKSDDPEGHPPAAAVELTLARHDPLD